MSVADHERAIRDKIISKLNADATTKEPTVVTKWYKSEPASSRRLPFGYVQFNRRSAVAERSEHTSHEYEFEFEVGVVQKVTRTQEQEADDWVTDLTAKVETVLLKSLDLDGVVVKISLPRDKIMIRGSTRELGDVAWGILTHRVRKPINAVL